jgi:hypothetical protein
MIKNNKLIKYKKVTLLKIIKSIFSIEFLNTPKSCLKIIATIKKITKK